MLNRPKIAIVGRPNVGKSALFNRICGKRLSIVDEAEGITRDRLYGDATLLGRPLRFIDTGGIHTASKVPFNEQILLQAQIAIEEADSLILVVDGTVGATDLDLSVATILLRTDKPVTLAVNKVDTFAQESLIHQFHNLGIQNIVPVSAAQGLNILDLLEQATAKLPAHVDLPQETPHTQVAIVGRPNVGKSTLLNHILKEQRSVVSPQAGTTRDAIDALIHTNDNTYNLIDTAGIRHKKSEKDVVDKFAAIRTQEAIERSDVCLLILDSEQGLTSHDKKIASDIEAAGKSCVLIFNKWDQIHGCRMEHCLAAIQQENPFLAHCPTLFISAKTGRNLEKIFPLIDTVAAARKQRIPTGQLNRFMEKALQYRYPPAIQGKRLRIYYLTQTTTAPPRFVLFVNNPSLLADSYRRYLVNQLREVFNFAGTPFHFTLRGKRGGGGGRGGPAPPCPPRQRGSAPLQTHNLLSFEIIAYTLAPSLRHGARESFSA